MVRAGALTAAYRASALHDACTRIEAHGSGPGPPPPLRGAPRPGRGARCLPPSLFGVRPCRPSASFLPAPRPPLRWGPCPRARPLRGGPPAALARPLRPGPPAPSLGRLCAAPRLRGRSLAPLPLPPALPGPGGPAGLRGRFCGRGPSGVRGFPAGPPRALAASRLRGVPSAFGLGAGLPPGGLRGPPGRLFWPLAPGLSCARGPARACFLRRGFLSPPPVPLRGSAWLCEWLCPPRWVALLAPLSAGPPGRFAAPGAASRPRLTVWKL